MGRESGRRACHPHRDSSRLPQGPAVIAVHRDQPSADGLGEDPVPVGSRAAQLDVHVAAGQSQFHGLRVEVAGDPQGQVAQGPAGPGELLQLHIESEPLAGTDGTPGLQRLNAEIPCREVAASEIQLEARLSRCASNPARTAQLALEVRPQGCQVRRIDPEAPGEALPPATTADAG